MSDRELFRNLLLNVVMGATLGALFITSLLVLNVHDISDTLQHSSSPVVVAIILITGSSVYFAFGAAITGLHFAITDESRSSGGRR
jgi:ABC-type Mn2+/Zn2+ transport system permease subunit